MSTLQELKIDRRISTQRAMRQWKKDLKATYAPLLEMKTKLSKVLEERERSKSQKAEEEKLRAKFEQEEQFRREIQQQEKELWEEKMRAELEMAEAAKAARAKLPELKITPFNGTPVDWIRFQNMFTSQIHDKPLSDEEKYGYRLELVAPKVRSRLANLKPGALEYKTAWERLKTEFGQSKTVITAHMEEIINLPVTRESNYERVREFYEKLSKNYDPLQTLGEGEMLKGFVLSTLNKLPQVKPDLVRTDEGWEDWNMEKLIDSIQKWLKRNNAEDNYKDQTETKRKERHYFSQKEPHCLFCDQKHWGDSCPTYNTIAKGREFFTAKRLCYNCARSGHTGKECRSRGCYKCKSKHHTSLCDRSKGSDTQDPNATLSGYTPSVEEKSLPAIVPLKIRGTTFWAYLDTGSGRNFISKEAAKKLKLNPIRHETRYIVTVNGTKKQSMPVYEVIINSIDSKATEKIEITGGKLADFTTIKRPTLTELKEKFQHVQGKMFYRTASEEYPIHVILGDATYCKIRAEHVYKGQPEDPIVEGTTFGWIVHGGKEYADSKCMYVRETDEYERLYSLDVLGVEDRGEGDQLDVYKEFQESISKRSDSRYEVGVPWIPAAKLSNTNEEPSRRRLHNVERKLRRNEKLKIEYDNIVHEQIEQGIIEKEPEQPRGERVFYMPHKPVVRESATSTKVRMVFDVSTKPHPLANSVNECMHTGPSLQPLLWNIMITARMSTDILLADLQKAFLQIKILFNINGKEEHLRFARVPFGAEASSFMLGATLQYHFNKQPPELQDTVQALKENTYVDNLMKPVNGVENLKEFKQEATKILEGGRFPVHKWESNIPELDDEDNPSKLLGLAWDKREDALEIQAQIQGERRPTKRSILSQFSSIYDPLGRISPTMVEGKRIYRESCDEEIGWNTEVNCVNARDWFKWSSQLRTSKCPGV
ncbi:uncharacterized protein [Montipora capricornis]|uniref:uncharacterized protein n=1 Tax=Montipora capricornis TaxID=246305 RepID=UPI0035F11C6E